MKKRLKLIGVLAALFVIFEVRIRYQERIASSFPISLGDGRRYGTSELTLAELLADEELMNRVMSEDLETSSNEGLEQLIDVASEEGTLLQGQDIYSEDEMLSEEREQFSEEDPTKEKNAPVYGEGDAQFFEDAESVSEEVLLPEEKEQMSEEGRLSEGSSSESPNSAVSSATDNVVKTDTEAMLEGELRALTVRKRCEEVRNHKTFPINPKFRIEKRIFFAKTEKLAYCSVAKAFSSSLKRIFLVLSKGGTAEDIATNPKLLTDINYPHYVNFFKNHTVLFHYPEHEWQQVLDTHYLFAFVRDPVEKVISAYRDKFFSKTKDVFHQYFKDAYGKDICRSMTNDAEQMEKMAATNYDCSADPPYFDLRAFLSWHFLVPNKVMGPGVEFNPHWGSDISICRLCDPEYHYQFIGHFESGDKDMEDLFSRAGWKFSLSPPQKVDMKLSQEEKDAFKMNVSSLPAELMDSFYRSVALERYILGYTDENPLS